MSDSTTETKDPVNSTVDDLRALIREAEEALGSGDSASEGIDDLRERLREAISDGETLIGNLTDNLKRQAKRADETIRANPYQTIGIATGVGLIAGFLLSRRCSSSNGN